MPKHTVVVNNRIAGYYTLHKGSVDENGVPIPGTHRQVAILSRIMGWIVSIKHLALRSVFSICRLNAV
jgi:hypothetical protein